MSYKKAIFFLVSLSSICSASVKIQDLTLEEKIGQLLLVHFHGEKANEEAQILLSKAHVGGFIYYNWSNELSSPEQVQELSTSLQQMNRQASSKIPLFIAADQEGGRVVRFKSGFTHFPSNQEVGLTEKPEIAFEAAQITATELKAVGVNMNLAPVVDVNNNPLNIVIGNRSYGSDPLQVMLFGKQALKGYQSQGIIGVLKHFPGHGDVTVDSHSATPIVSKSLEELQRIEFFPFQKLCHETDALMTAHLIVSSIDSLLPASVSSALLIDVLRNQWRYEGLIISDSLVMKGILPNNNDIENVALLTLQAGTDILCLGGKLLNETTQDELRPADVLRIHRFLVDSVREGTLSEKRVNESVKRVLKIKEKYNLANQSYAKAEDITNQVGTLRGKHLVQEITILNNLTTALTKDSCKKMAQQIWQNESGGSSEKLLFWNPQEEFLSLGISHMIWYPSNSSKTFEEGFCKYIEFLQKKDTSIPSWLNRASECPWKNREEFLANQSSPQAEELKQWLLDTFDSQAQYLVFQLKNTIYQMLKETRGPIKQKLLNELLALTSTPAGIYALTDYLNFKGSGLSPKERYQEKGWGLFQVLTEMSSDDSEPAIERFIASAQTLLTQRVQNAPSSRQEDKWLKGWLKRVQTYRYFSVY